MTKKVRFYTGVEIDKKELGTLGAQKLGKTS